ncbi:MAG: Xaa-Pro peptidase family protein [Anaerolineae bacterium]
MGFMILERARRALAGANLDALIILSPRHFYYATGHRSWYLGLYSEAGYGAAIVPADAAVAPAAVISDVEEPPFRETAPDFPNVATYPTWIAYADVPPLSDTDAFAHLAHYQAGQPARRAGQVDSRDVVRRVASLLHDIGLARGRLGIERGFVSAPVLGWLREELPDVEWQEATPVLEGLRAQKSAVEAALLRRGTQLAEAAIGDVMAWIRPGVTGAMVGQRYRAAVLNRDDRGDVSGARITLRVGPHVLSPRSSGNYVLAAGDLVFMDVGVDVAGYLADMGRCFVVGRASPGQREIYQALRAGFDAATERLYVGETPARVFSAGMAAVHASGLTSYVRGNIGHGIGLHPAPEWPILSREEPLILAPGHVVSVEFPYYIQGIGAFQIEDTFYLTEGEREVFNRLSRDLVEVG